MLRYDFLQILTQQLRFLATMYASNLTQQRVLGIYSTDIMSWRMSSNVAVFQQINPYGTSSKKGYLKRYIWGPDFN